MTTTIGRRFILKTDTREWWMYRDETMRIQQGFLFINDDKSIYVSLENANRASLCFRNENLGVPDIRFKFRIPRRVGNVLFWLCRKRILIRTRHQVFYEKRLWRINVFRDKHQGLLLGEIELTSNDEEVILPPWIVSDVTMEKEYTFAELARKR